MFHYKNIYHSMCYLGFGLKGKDGKSVCLTARRIVQKGRLKPWQSGFRRPLSENASLKFIHRFGV